MENKFEELHDKYYDLIEEFNEICEKFDIEYYASYGSLIGQVLHGKIIPWDDDFDVIMPRKDYNKFLEIIRQKKVMDVQIHNSDNNEEWSFGFSKLTFDNYEAVYDDGYNETFDNLWIDIAPLDSIDENDYKQYKALTKIIRYNEILSKVSLESINNENKKIKKTMKKVVRKFYSKKRVLDKIDKLKKTLRGNQLVDTTVVYSTSKCIFKKEDIFPIEKEKFGRIEVGVPANPEKILDSIYPKWRSIPKMEDQINSHNLKAVVVKESKSENK